MNKVLAVLGLAGAGLIAYLYFFSGSDSTAGAGGGSKKEDSSDPTLGTTGGLPYILNIEAPEFPSFDFSLPDPYKYDSGGSSGSGSSKKSKKSGDLASTYLGAQESQRGTPGYAVGSIKEALKRAGYGGSKKETTTKNDYGIVFPPGGF